LKCDDRYIFLSRSRFFKIYLNFSEKKKIESGILF
jgi:hypothetical protein